VSCRAQQPLESGPTFFWMCPNSFRLTIGVAVAGSDRFGMLPGPGKSCCAGRRLLLLLVAEFVCVSLKRRGVCGSTAILVEIQSKSKYPTQTVERRIH